MHRSLRRALPLLVLLAIAAALAFRLLGGREKPRPPEETVPVSVATALAQDVPHFLQGIGTVTPSADVLVTSRVTGELMSLHFAEGDRVSEGELLAQIDPRPFEAALAQAKGALARDEAELANAKRDAGRYARLAAKDYVAAQTYDQQLATVRQLEGTVAADRGSVRAAELDLLYSSISAPVSGRLGLRNVDPGTLVTANDETGIVRITETSPCYVVFSLPEVNVHLLAEAAKGGERPLVEAWSRDQRERVALGELMSLDNRIDVATGTIRLKALFKNDDGRLFANEFVNARVRVRVLQGAVTVPPAAVQTGAQGTYLFVVDGEDVAHMRPMKVVLATGAASVVEGVEAGERVVVDGVDRLRQGSRVRVAGQVETVRLADRPSPLATENAPEPLPKAPGAGR